MEQYIIFDINIEKVKKKNYKLDIDYCSSNLNEISVYTESQEYKKIKNDGFNIEKVKNEVIVSQKNNLKTKLGSYHHQKDLKNFILNLKRKYNYIFDYEIIGKTKENREIFMTQVTLFKNTKYKPVFLLIANIHGDETIGREISLYLMNYLCVEYNRNPDIKKIVDNFRIYILPSLNPDGFERKLFGRWSPSRYNSNGIDLNRNFPDQFKTNNIQRELEVEAIMNWSKKNQVHLSLSIHGGTLVVNYPYDGPKTGVYSKCPHDNYFKYLSKEYIKYNSELKKSNFKNSMTNGSEWYAVFGGMQDWRYVYKDGYELTLELSKKKVVKEEDIYKYWLYNRNSLINYLKLLHTGLEGLLTLKDIKEKVILKNLDDNYITKIKPNKYFFEPLKPGNYKIIYQNINRTFYIEKNIRYKLFFNESSDKSFQLTKNILKSSFNRKNKCVIL